MLPGRKATTNLDSLLKSRDIILPTKAHIVKALVYPVVMYRYESWTIKKAQHQGTDAFELWCYTLESPSDSKDLAAAAADSKEIKPVNPKGNQPSIFIGRTDVKA